MRMQGPRRLAALGLAAAVVSVGAGCSSGGHGGDGEDKRTSDLGMQMLQDLHSPDLRSPDLRRPLSSALSLGMPVGYMVGSSTDHMIVHDMNGDGLLDVVVSGGPVGVLLGKGDGTFQPAKSATAPTSSDLAAADLNGDAKTDLVLVSGTDVFVLLGKGDGTFQAPLSTPLGGNGTGVAVGDVNGDGKIDLAIGIFMTGMDNFVHVLPGLGNGTFGSAVKVQAGRRTQTVRLTDLNRDGKLDLAVTNNDSDSVTVAIGRGDGTFAAPQHLSSERHPMVVDAVDMDLDGAIDLVVGSEVNSSFSVHRGKGDGTFEMPPSSSTTLNESHSHAVGDLNGDSVPDVVICATGISSQFNVALGKGDGSFLAPRAFKVDDTVSVVAQGDFNRDGLADVAVTSGRTVYVLLNTTAAP